MAEGKGERKGRGTREKGGRGSGRGERGEE